MSSANGNGQQPPDPALSHAASLPRLSQREQDGVWVIAVHGDFDADSSPALAKALDAAARTYPRVVVDATGMTFADSTVLNLLLKFNLTTTELRVAGPAQPFLRVLELTGADRVLDIRPTVDDAVKS
ncbi:STAS domain-containing protein [Streptomyces sp. NPDC007162]|uniref:STAS domain-containing protein n=1 Tax=Streptomyces sp. NPDC007162 TaxID=3156917 RepID=UPI003409C903